MKNKKIGIRILIAATGLMLSGLGVGIFLYSSLGVDPASVLTQGLGNVFQLRYGVMAALINVAILAIAFLIDKRYVNIASVMAIFLIGATADIVSVLLSMLIEEQIHTIIRYAMILTGCVIISMGIATYIRADIGVGAIDLVSEIINDKTKIPYRVARIGADVMFVAVGYLLGGNAGVGTLVGALLIGPAVQVCRPLVYKIVDPLLGRAEAKK